MDDLTDTDAFGFCERAHRAVQGVGIEGIRGLQPVAKTAQSRLDPRLAHPLVERRPIVCDLVVRLEELDLIRISIDLLSPLEEVQSEAELDPVVYGLMVRAGRKKGLLLPDLPGVRTVQRQIEICREKAGIPAGEPVTMERFVVERIEE